MTPRNRLIVEAAVIVLVVVVAWAFIYSSLLEACCGFADFAVIVVLWSASQIGGLLTGTKDLGRGAVLLGLIIEALAVWASCRWAWSLRKGKQR